MSHWSSVLLQGLAYRRSSAGFPTIPVALASICSFCILASPSMSTTVLWGAVSAGLITADQHDSQWRRYVIAILCALVAGAVLLAFVDIGVGDGVAQIPVAFEVCDAETGLPIAGARVRIRDVSSHDLRTVPPTSMIPLGGEGVESTTDEAGNARIAYPFLFSTRHTCFTVRVKVWVHGSLDLTIEASGYTASTTALCDHTGSSVESRLDGSDLTQVIEIRLKRAAGR
jgi:hypothetical protein